MKVIDCKNAYTHYLVSKRNDLEKFAEGSNSARYIDLYKLVLNTLKDTPAWGVGKANMLLNDMSKEAREIYNPTRLMFPGMSNEDFITRERAAEILKAIDIACVKDAKSSSKKSVSVSPDILSDEEISNFTQFTIYNI